MESRLVIIMYFDRQGRIGKGKFLVFLAMLSILCEIEKRTYLVAGVSLVIEEKVYEQTLIPCMNSLVAPLAFHVCPMIWISECCYSEASVELAHKAIPVTMHV